MLRPGAQDLSLSTQHHPAKPGPVFVVPINHYSDQRVALDVADALECWSSHALRLLVDGDVKGALRNRKTHRHDVRNGPAIGRGKMPDPLRQQEPAFLVWRHVTVRRAMTVNRADTARLGLASPPRNLRSTKHRQACRRDSKPRVRSIR